MQIIDDLNEDYSYYFQAQCIKEYKNMILKSLNQGKYAYYTIWYIT